MQDSDQPQPDESKIPETGEGHPEEPLVTVSGGRRREKRKVMKKVRTKDEEGYLGELGMCGSVSRTLADPRSNEGRGHLGVLFGRGTSTAITGA